MSGQAKPVILTLTRTRAGVTSPSILPPAGILPATDGAC
jgi:hypothetical protein